MKPGTFECSDEGKSSLRDFFKGSIEAVSSRCASVSYFLSVPTGMKPGSLKCSNEGSSSLSDFLEDVVEAVSSR